MNYSQKLERLKNRRQGFYSKDGTFNFAEALLQGRKTEKFEKLTQPQAVKYAIGAMQAVDEEYTRNSYAEGNRVRDRLAEGLTTLEIPAAFEYQGSVPLDVHVRGNSDVDLLVLHDGFVTAEVAVWGAYNYAAHGGRTPTEELMLLRQASAATLRRRYPAADVDLKPMAIALSGGSLARNVDVVPSHWHDTLLWKQTGDQRYRDIFVLDADKGERVRNAPFMHIARIRDKCQQTGGALRKVIRLLKNLRYDAERQIDLSSYDIAAIAWNMTVNELTVPYGVDLLLVERARDHLQVVVSSASYRDLLEVPNGTRKIFDEPAKLQQAILLYREVDRLYNDMVTELTAHAALGLVPADVMRRPIIMA